MQKYFLIFVLLTSFLALSCKNDNGTEPKVNGQPTITSITANPTTVMPEQTSTIEVSASDPDNDALTYSYTSTGGNIAGNGNSVTFTAGQVEGAASIMVTVSDGRGGIATSSTTLTIELPPPAFTVSGLVVQAEGGGSCLQFFAIPQEDVILNSVTVRNPLGTEWPYSFGGGTLVEGERLQLQESGKCYANFSGDWQFTFKGSRPGGKSFVSTASYTSGGLAKADTNCEICEPLE